MAWRCRFLTARRSQRGHGLRADAVAELRAAAALPRTNIDVDDVHAPVPDGLARALAAARAGPDVGADDDGALASADARAGARAHDVDDDVDALAEAYDVLRGRLPPRRELQRVVPLY